MKEKARRFWNWLRGTSDGPAIESRSGDVTRSRIENKGIWKRFFHLCKVARIPYLTLLLYIVLEAAYSAFIIYVPEVNADFFTGDASVRSVSMFLLVELASMAAGQVTLYVAHVFRAKTNRNLRNALWGKILRLKPKYFDQVSANTLLSRITVDADSLNSFVMDIILSIFFSVYSLVLTIKEMSDISMQAAIRLLALVPVFLLLSFIRGRLNLRFENDAKFKLSDLTDYLSELVASLPIIKSLNRQAYESRRGRAVIDGQYRAQRNLIWMDVLLQIISTPIGMLPDIFIILMGVKMLQNSTLTPAGWYVFYIYAGSLVGFVSNLGSFWAQGKAVQGQLNKVSDVLSEEEESLGPYIKEAVESGDIVFDHVTFSYGGTPALDDVSFTIPKGHATALVGYSGAGKSTVLKLLERIYEPDQGRILLCGNQLKDYDIREWRSRIAFVTQNSPMISGTIRENVLYGIRREVSDREIMEAAKMVYVDQFIESCPDGLDHQVGQFGSRLSGGQRQKLSIVRAILARPDYLVLDEPTASLDVISTEEVARAVQNLRSEATVILVAHQADIIRCADHVIVLEQDHTAAEGGPDQMLAASPFFAQLMAE